MGISGFAETETEVQLAEGMICPMAAHEQFMGYGS